MSTSCLLVVDDFLLPAGAVRISRSQHSHFHSTEKRQHRTLAAVISDCEDWPLTLAESVQSAVNSSVNRPPCFQTPGLVSIAKPSRGCDSRRADATSIAVRTCGGSWCAQGCQKRELGALPRRACPSMAARLRAAQASQTRTHAETVAALKGCRRLVLGHDEVHERRHAFPGAGGCPAQCVKLPAPVLEGDHVVTAVDGKRGRAALAE